MSRTILIGDVHGCSAELRSLLTACEYSTKDEVVFVGDLVAKGPDSQGVVQIARDLGARGVRGNHDHHVLTWRRKSSQRGEPVPPLKPQHQQVADTLKEADWQYIGALPLVLRLTKLNVIVVHGGIVPGIPIGEQRPEHLLNLRSIAAGGKASKRASDGEPWASTWTGPEHVVFGHDAVRGLQQYPLATGLDTGCVYGKQLTALILPERRLVQVQAVREWSQMKAPKG